MVFSSTYLHDSGRLVAVVVRWDDLELLLIAAYLPARPKNSAPFYRDCLGPFLNTLPDLKNILAKKKGVREKVKQVLRDAGGDLAVLLLRLSSCLRAYSREETKRINATKAHLEREVEVFRSRLSRKPGCQRTGAILLKKEELLNAYEKRHMEKLQAWAGIKWELDGEATSGFMTGKIKTRKSKTEVHEVKLKGKVFTEVLVAATEFFEDDGDDSDEGVVELPPLQCTISEATKEALRAPWSGEEVQTAVRELASAWAEGLHRETGTRVHVNGWTGDIVAVKKGVRQGCPLAPFLFLCAVEPLCEELTKCKLGFGRRDTGKLAYLGYADDTSLLTWGAEQVSVAAGVLDEFGKKSGQK
ncbi:unnamed protein product [Closterium sp. Yama58-4]|nr:unnamed protein product [Closterium sp. Yama58-4]